MRRSLVLLAQAAALAACGGGDLNAPADAPGNSAATAATAAASPTSATPAVAAIATPVQAPPSRQVLAAAANPALVNAPFAIAAAAGAAAEPEGLIAVFPGAGELRGATAIASFSVQAITDAVNIPGARTNGVVPRFGVNAWRLRYTTTDGQGRPVVASGLVAVPNKPINTPSPVISYQHGTIFKDAEAPSNAMLPGEAPIAMASLGYIVVAADYVGYGASKNVQHPYLMAAPTAAAVNDFLTAARIWRQSQPTKGNGQLFLLGYSEGGYASAAAHRALQASNSLHLKTLVATVSGGGPQDVGSTLDHLLNQIKDRSVILGALINPGFLRYLGSTVRDEVRRQMQRAIIPDDADVSFQTTVLDYFLADDIGAMDRDCNVLEWAPTAPAVPVRLFHGKDDRTVAYKSSTVALQYMLARGASPALVSLTDCAASPSDHLPCAREFFGRAANYMGTLARGL